MFFCCAEGEEKSQNSSLLGELGGKAEEKNWGQQELV